MQKGRKGISAFLALGALILAGGVLAAPDLNPAMSSQSGAMSHNLAFALLVPQKRVLRVPSSQAIPQDDLPESLRAKRDKDLRKYRFEKMKDNAAELAKLSASLKDDLDKSNENILSLQVVDKAEKIEKLAKKIQDEAKTGM